jgi:predicted amidohydrolase
MAGDSRQLGVAAAQINLGTHIEDNLERILWAMDAGAQAGARVVVLPETALSGYSPTIGHGRDAKEWPALRRGLDVIAERSTQRGLWTVVGSEAWDGAAWVNRLYAFSAEGGTAATYDKVHLMNAETRYYRPGSGAPTVFDIDGVRAGLQICYDVRFPEGYRRLLAQGVEVVLQAFYGAGGDTWKVPVLEAHLRSRAAETGCFIVAANVAGPLQIVVSQIVDPIGLILARANQDHKEIITATLALQRVAESEIRKDYLTRFVC